MTYTGNNWQKDIREASRGTLIFFAIAVIAVVASIFPWVLYINRVNESQLVINCSSFTSIVEATSFGKTHPEYMKRLNPLGKEFACTSHAYPHLPESINVQ